MVPEKSRGERLRGCNCKSREANLVGKLGGVVWFEEGSRASAPNRENVGVVEVFNVAFQRSRSIKVFFDLSFEYSGV